jgi:hypothetical protein
MVMNLAQAMLAGRSLEEMSGGTKKQNTQGEGKNVVHFATSLWLWHFLIGNPRFWHPKWMERCLWEAARVYEKIYFHG